MQPLVVVDGEYSASLDGVTLSGERILEVKCPMKGRESELWKMVAAGRLLEYYRSQVEHQLMVTRAEVADVYVFDGKEGILLETRPDSSAWPQIREAWDKFAAFVSAKSPPALAQGDVRERTDAAWSNASAHYLETKLFADQAQKALAEAKEQLVALTSHTSESGGGVTVTRYCKAGAVDFRKIPELQAIDLEQYRGAPREEARVTLTTPDPSHGR